MQTLQFEKREKDSKLGRIRFDGKMPAVFYGPKEASTPIAIKEVEFKKVWRSAGESSIVILKNGDEEHETLIKDVDLHPVSGVPLHADFYVIEKGKKLTVTVQLEFEGTSPAVKDLGATLVKVLHEIEVEAMPKDLPHDLKVDISSLVALDSQILAKDITLPTGVTLVTGPEEVVAAVAAAREEEEEVATTPTIDDIEVVGAKGKKEEEGAEGGETAEAKE